jgi:hypothetical protein
MENYARHLARAVKAATTAMTPMRNNRHMFLKQYAGPYFAVRQAKEASATATPLNMIHSLVSVVLPHLVSGCPKAMIVARRPELKEAAEIFSLAWDRMAVDIDLGSTMRTIVTDAMFGAGIIKVGLCQSEENAAAAQEPEGYLHDNGRPFADAIDLDDYIIDPDARDRQAAAFEGNQYRLPLQYVLESGLYDRRAAGRLAPVNSPKDGAIEPMVELIDLWLPRENAVVTISADTDSPAGILRRVEWDGPERGPYEVLGFHWAPNNVMPIPPVAMIFDLHAMINKIARKISRQVERQKDLVLFDERCVDEAQRVRDAADGELVGVQSVDRYRQLSLGGADQRGYEHLAFLFEQFSRLGGNIDLLGGLATQSKTLGQDEMLFANATIRIEDMRQQTHQFTRRFGAKLAWHLWQDPLIELPLARNGVMATFRPEERRGEFLDYIFDIEPYSMTQDSPTRRYRRIVEWIDRVVLPTADIAAKQGRTLDAAALAKAAAKMLNIDEAQHLWRDAELPAANH